MRIVYYIDPGSIYDIIPIEASAVLYDLAILVWIDVGYMLVFYWYVHFTMSIRLDTPNSSIK